MNLTRTRGQIEEFIKQKGVPSLVVGPRALKFQLLEWFHGAKDVNIITLPSTVWERDKIYMEHALSSIIIMVDKGVNN